MRPMISVVTPVTSRGIIWFSFFPGEHYLRGETMIDIFKLINSVISSRVETTAISENDVLLCKSIFHREFNNSTIARIMYNALLR